MYIWCKNTAYRAYKHARMGQFDSSSIRLHTGLNMMTACQILLRDHDTPFEITGVSLEGNSEGVDTKFFYQDFIVFDDELLYPDLLCEKESVHVPRNVTQGIYLVFRVLDAGEGTRRFTCTVNTSLGDFKAHITLAIHQTRLSEPKDAALQYEYFANFYGNLKRTKGMTEAPMTPYYDFEAYTPQWWKLMKSYAEYFKLFRINTLYVPLMELLQDAGSRRISKTKWKLDFSLFDELVGFFLENGSFSRIAIPHLIKPLAGNTVSVLDEVGELHTAELKKDEDARLWLEAVYTAIYEHFSEKGWLSLLQMHVQDEPHQTEYWLWAREIMKRCMPGVLACEPIDTAGIGEGLGDALDIPIPRFEVYEADKTYYDKQIESGRTLWSYSCCFPEEPWWLNKFLDLPPHYSCMLYWACFSQGFTGYLHWGFNQWETGDSLYCGKSSRFKGDPFVVWPDVEKGSILPTVRAITSIEGAQDYELLYQLSKVDKTVAKNISCRVARTFREFAENPLVLENAREEILTLLDGWHSCQSAEYKEKHV